MYPAEMVQPFVKLGARFSFSGYFALESISNKRIAFEKVPLDRLLIETDAPDMLGPDALVAEPLYDADSKKINSPLNLPLIYEYAAEMRGMELSSFSRTIGRNFEEFFK